MRARPLAGLCAAYAAGTLLAWRVPWLVWVLAVAVVVTAGFAVTRRRPAAILIAVLSLAGWIGAIRYTVSVSVPNTDVSRFPETTYIVQGLIVQDLTLLEDPHSDEASAAKFVLDVRSIRMDTGSGPPTLPIAATGRLACRLTLRSRTTHAALSPDLLPASGDIVSLRGRLEYPQGPRNPGGFDYRAYLERQGVHATLQIRQPEQAKVLERARWRSPYGAIASALSGAIRNACSRALRPPYGGVLAGVLIGDKRRIPVSLQEDFERTGTTHLLATAGLHVGIVVCLLTALLRRCRVPRRPALATAVGLLSLYAAMAGDRAAVIRAVAVASYYLIGELLEREPDLWNGLSIAMLGLLAANPLDLFEPGFQLSFATVATIAVLMPLLEPVRSALDRGPTLRALHPVVRAGFKQLVALVLLCAAAQIGSAPLVAGTFYNISTVSVAANVVAVPIVFLVISLGFPMALLWSIHPALGQPVAALLDLLLHCLVGTVQAFSRLPIASVNISPPPAGWIVAYYLFVWCGALWLRIRIGRRPNIPPSPQERLLHRCAVAAALAAAMISIMGAAAAGRPELRVTFLDVGQGDACVIESPGGKVLVVDTGGLVQEGEDDEGRRVVSPYLRFRGISRIDAISLSHPHADHIGGASTLLRQFQVGQLQDDGEAFGSPIEPAILDMANAKGSRIVVARPGQELDFGDGVRADVLGPPESLALSGANNASVVLRVRYGRTSFLFTGDAEADEEAEILRASPNLRCDVLKVGHHGSHTSTTPPLLQAAHPAVAVISVGRHNLYGHPSPEVLDRLNAAGVRVFRTDRSGAIVCRSNGLRVQVEPMLREP